MEIIRLHLARFNVIEEPWPVHGFVIPHPRLGAVLVDTGCGGPEQMMRDYRVVNRAVEDALAEHGLSPADVKAVINTHLHFDHCGQNAVFKHAPVYVQRSELERARRESPDIREWFDYTGAVFELLDGDAELAPDLHVVATPGHTVGHQSVLAETAPGRQEVMVGDAAFTADIWAKPDEDPGLPLQFDDQDAWSRSLHRLQDMGPARVHFCHDERSA